MKLILTFLGFLSSVFFDGVHAKSDWSFEAIRSLKNVSSSLAVSALESVPNSQVQAIPVLELRPPQSYTHYSIEVPLVLTNSKEEVFVKTDHRSAQAEVIKRNDTLILQVSDSVWSGMSGIFWNDMDFWLYDSISSTKTVRLSLACIGPEVERDYGQSGKTFIQENDFDSRVLITNQKSYPKQFGSRTPDGALKLGKWQYWNDQHLRVQDTIWNKKVVIGKYNSDSCGFNVQVNTGGEWKSAIYYHLENEQPVFYITREEDSLRFSCGECRSWCDLSALYAPHPEMMFLSFDWVCGDQLYLISNGIPKPIQFIENQYAIFWDWLFIRDEYGEDVDPRDSIIKELEKKWPNVSFVYDPEQGAYFLFSQDVSFNPIELQDDKRIRLFAKRVRIPNGYPIHFDEVLYIKFKSPEQKNVFLERSSELSLEEDVSQKPFGSYFIFRTNRKLLDADFILELKRLSSEFPGIIYELNWYSRIELDEFENSEMIPPE